MIDFELSRLNLCFILNVLKILFGNIRLIGLLPRNKKCFKINNSYLLRDLLIHYQPGSKDILQRPM